MTDSRPTRATPGGRAYLDLQNLARRTRRNTQELLHLYALEGFLARLATSRHVETLVLKGGVLLAAYDARRPTRDVDLQGQRMSADMADVLAIAKQVAAVALDDGLEFNAAAASASTIREDHSYRGTRVRLEASLASSRVTMHVDVNIGDPIWPEPRPLVLPGLLGRRVEVMGYPLSMVYAEKIVTMLERGSVNTRWRDFADVYLLSGRHEIQAAELSGSIDRVVEHRAARRAPLETTLRAFPAAAQSRWATWRRKQQVTDLVPLDLATTLQGVSAFVDPILRGELTNGVWNPLVRAWRP